MAMSVTTIALAPAPALPTPSVLVVGFDADPMLTARYAGKVKFLEYDRVKRPEDIPGGIARVIFCSSDSVPRQSRERIGNLAQAVNAVSEPSNTLVTLRERLLALFPDPPPLGKSAEPILSAELRKIRAVKVTAGTLREFVRDNMVYPCVPKEEAARLFPLAQGKKLTESVDSIYQVILIIIGEAGLREKKPPPASPSAATSPLDLSSTTGEVRGIQTELQALIDKQGLQHNADMSALRTLQQRVHGFEVMAAAFESLRTENQRLRDERDKARQDAQAANDILDSFRKRLNTKT